MPQMAVSRVGAVFVIHSFTTGVKCFEPKDWNIRCDTDALAYALYLERRGKEDEAMAFLEQYLRKQPR